MELMNSNCCLLVFVLWCHSHTTCGTDDSPKRVFTSVFWSTTACPRQNGPP